MILQGDFTIKLTRILIILFTWVELCCYSLNAQSKDPKSLMKDFARLYSSGNLIQAEKILTSLFDSQEKLTDNYKVAVYNNLGAVCTALGKYNEALFYYNKSEELEALKGESTKTLGDIYINKAIIFGKQKAYNQALEFYDKGIIIYRSIQISSNALYNSIPLAYLNSGALYIELQNIPHALERLYMSEEISLKYKFQDIAFVYMNLAKAYFKAGERETAESYFIKSIKTFINDYGKDYYRLTGVYNDYGVFLKDEKRFDESLEMLLNSLRICLNKYGKFHTLTSLTFKLIGDNFLARQLPDSALVYYQKSLIAIVPGFNSMDIKDNPSIDSSLFDIRLLDNLKSKARALELLSGRTFDNRSRISILGNGVETISLALKLIEGIRKGYPDEESRLFMAENEKETYDFAMNILCELYTLSPDEKIKKRMYQTAVMAKSAVLRDELSGYEMQKAAGVPDSLIEKVSSLTGMAAAYNNLILEETRKSKPDSGKIRYWKEEIFTMNREKEKIITAIKQGFPRYSELMQKTKPLPAETIQRQLRRDETVLDYYLSSGNDSEGRKLYIFIITREDLGFYYSPADTLLNKNIKTIADAFSGFAKRQDAGEGIKEITGSLSYLYNVLFLPVKDKLKGRRIKIIPDGEIFFVPFDALISVPPEPGQQSFEGLSYLINEYLFSYGYSSSLLTPVNRARAGVKVYAFAPDYSAFPNGYGRPGMLAKAEDEIRSVFRWFKGIEYSGTDANTTSFIRASGEPGILHLAMHLASDTSDSKYSYLIFDSRCDSVNGGKLYNYEISAMRIKSPVVVLSACNSGGGTFIRSEGLMSIARSFIMAGASSVVKTSWEINDETSAEIMSSFYKYLSEGKAKDEALRLAKLDYFEGHPPAYTDPYYWAAYEVLGDISPVVKNKNNRFTVAVISLVSVAILLIIYSRRRKIFSAFSR